MSYTQEEVDLLIAEIGRLVQVLENVLQDACPDHGYFVLRPATIAAVSRALHNRSIPPVDPNAVPPPPITSTRRHARSPTAPRPEERREADTA